MASKYAVMSNVRYDEKCVITSKGHHSERGSAISDCLACVYNYTLSVTGSNAGLRLP